jgi:oxygen-dependent protoporphyrinogen oxidase
LLSPAGKARLALEPFVRRRQDADDESVRAFARRRFGAEVSEAIIEPLIGGIYGGDADRLSAEACLPRFRTFEREHGSVTRGVHRAVRAWRRQATLRLPPTVTFRGGMASLPDALTAALGPVVTLGVEVQRVLRRGSRRFGVETTRGTIECEGVVLAVPAWAAPRLVEQLSMDLAAAHAALAHKPLVCVALAWRRRDVPHPLDGTGWVRGAGDRHATLACTWASEKWSERAPPEFVLVRSVLATHDMPDRAVVETARRDLRDLIGVAAAPSLVRTKRRAQATPIYEIGHLERAARMRDEARALGAVALAGSAYGGIGLPDCIASGEHAAGAVLHALGR